MSDTLKTIAEWMGYRWHSEPIGEMVFTYWVDADGDEVSNWDPTACLNALQQAVDKFTPAQCDLYYEKKYLFAWAKIRKEGGDGDILSKYMECIPTTTLADIVAAVIKETR